MRFKSMTIGGTVDIQNKDEYVVVSIGDGMGHFETDEASVALIANQWAKFDQDGRLVERGTSDE